jgi:hypothetical protein
MSSRISHALMTWILTPAMSFLFLFFCSAWLFELSKKTLASSIIYGVAFLFMTAAGYKHYYLNKNKIYFYIVCLAPAILGMLLSISSVVVYLVYGYSK